MNTRFLPACCVLGLAFLSGPLILASGKPASDSPDLKKLTESWRNRAKHHLRDLKIYPNIKEEDVAPWVGKVDELILGEIIKPQDRESEMDAYLRLQLLAFKPDIEKADLKLVTPLLNAKPALQAIPQPNKNQMKIFDAGARDVLPAKNIQPHIDAYNSTTAINTKNIEYRDALSKALPRKAGIRLYAMAMDMKERYMAGDPSYTKVRDAILKSEALGIWDSREPIPPKMQQEILAQVDELMNFYKDPLNRKIHRVELEANGRVKINRLGEPLNANQLRDLRQFVTMTKPAE